MAYPFVVFEGIDGCGKDTQAQLLLALLRRRRLPAFLHQYPTAKAGVSAHLASKATLSQDELFDKFLSDLQNDQPALLSHLSRGWVLADRYCLSTVAYQGAGGRLQERLRAVDARPWVKPNVVLWLDLPVGEAMARKAGQKSPDRHEADRAFLESVRENYAQLFRTRFLCANYKRIDASLSPEKVAEQIRKALEF